MPLAQAHASQRITPAEIVDVAQGSIHVISIMFTPENKRKVARKMNQQVQIKLESDPRLLNYRLIMPRVQVLYVERAHSRNPRLV